MSDTPRTDATWEMFREGRCGTKYVSEEMAKLERELNEVNELVNEKEAALMECGYKIAGLQQQLNQWRECAEELASHIPFQGHTPHPDEAAALAKFNALKAEGDG